MCCAPVSHPNWFSKESDGDPRNYYIHVAYLYIYTLGVKDDTKNGL